MKDNLILRKRKFIMTKYKLYIAQVDVVVRWPIKPERFRNLRNTNFGVIVRNCRGGSKRQNLEKLSVLMFIKNHKRLSKSTKLF